MVSTASADGGRVPATVSSERRVAFGSLQRPRPDDVILSLVNLYDSGAESHSRQIQHAICRLAGCEFFYQLLVVLRASIPNGPPSFLVNL